RHDRGTADARSPLRRAGRGVPRAQSPRRIGGMVHASRRGMANPFDDFLDGDCDPLSLLGDFAEGGRGMPVALSRPGPALPTSPLTHTAYAARTPVRLGWGHGVLTVADISLETPAALMPSDSPSDAASLMKAHSVGFVPVVETDEHGRPKFVGALYEES